MAPPCGRFETERRAAAIRLLLGLAAFALESCEIAEAAVASGVALLEHAGVIAGGVDRRRIHTACSDDSAEAREGEQKLDELQGALRLRGRCEEHGDTVPPPG